MHPHLGPVGDHLSRLVQNRILNARIDEFALIAFGSDETNNDVHTEGLDAAAASPRARLRGAHPRRRDSLQGDGVHDAREVRLLREDHPVERAKRTVAALLPVPRRVVLLRRGVVRAVVRGEPVVAAAGVATHRPDVDRVAQLGRERVVNG